MKRHASCVTTGENHPLVSPLSKDYAVRKLVLLSLLALICAPTASRQAGAIYVGPPGFAGECPADADGPFAPQRLTTRQYSVDPSLRCVFIRTATTSRAPKQEADDYLNSLAANLAGGAPSARQTTGTGWGRTAAVAVRISSASGTRSMGATMVRHSLFCRGWADITSSRLL